MAEAVKVTNERYRLKYHVSTPGGWMNDPNGFSFFKGYYHLFYQYYPYSAQKGPMHWGHYRSRDLVHWEELPIALAPDDEQNVCFSGSAIEKDGRLYLIYTGHQYHDLNDHTQFTETQNIAYSDDGIHFKKDAHNPIIAAAPADNTQHFRDPKVWRQGKYYYMILGSQAANGLGRALTYRSENLFDWEYLGPIANAQTSAQEGFMWECPDLFTLGDHDILLCSPQGIEPDGLRFLNEFQTGYFSGKMDYQQNKFTHGAFTELDHGHDFYAAQTMLAPDHRRILIGWMDMWNANFPEQADGWSGALTVPRELSYASGHLYMKPIAELMSLRTEKIMAEEGVVTSLEVTTPDPQHCELLFEANTLSWPGNEISFTLESKQQDLVSLTWNKKTGQVTVIRADKPDGDDKRYGNLQASASLKLHIFIDTSSIEFFLNDGELVFSERYYTENQPQIFFSADKGIKAKVEGYTLAQ